VADAGRVIAGTARGIRLEAPGPGTRPLGDRVKQTLFAMLEPDLPGSRVLDLFAGSGAAGIEALSRGAAHATFVERDRAASRVIAANLDRTHLAGERATVVTTDALAWLRRAAAPSTVARSPSARSAAAPSANARSAAARSAAADRADEPATVARYDIVVLDPPYAEPGLLQASLEALQPHLADGARVVAKHFWRDQPPVKVGLLASERERRFGETALTFYRRQEDR
jgi:16S rRNA (guanine966-N2)-methyltransferase